MMTAMSVMMTVLALDTLPQIVRDPSISWPITHKKSGCDVVTVNFVMLLDVFSDVFSDHVALHLRPAA